MRQIFVVYETDAWHSTSHRDCAGVFTSKWAAVNAIVKNHRIELDEFFDEDEIKHTSKRVQCKGNNHQNGMGYKVHGVARHATSLYQLFNPYLNLFHSNIFAAKIRKN